MGAAYWVRDGALLHVSIYSLVYNGRRWRRAYLHDFKHIAYIFLKIVRLLCVLVKG